MPPMTRPAQYTSIVVLLIAAAAALRSVGLAYGLPAVYNPDEVAIMNRALSLSQTGLNPQNFVYPSFYFYVLFAWEGLLFAIGRLSGAFQSLAAFETLYFVDPSTIYLAGRALTVLCGAATVWAVYRLGRVLFGPLAGVGAAVLMAAAPLAVRDAHYVKHDVPVTLLITLTCLVLATDLVSTHGRRRTVAGGVLAGLAMSTHYYAVFLTLPVAMIALHPRVAGEPIQSRLRRLVVAGLAVTAAFFAASPFLIADPLTAIRDMVANREIVVDRATTATGLFGSLGFYLRWLSVDAMGLTGFALAMTGIGVAAALDWRRLGFLLVFPAVFLLFIANTFPASRYLNPILPFLAILGGVAFAALYRWRRGGQALALVLVVLAALESTIASVRIDRFFQQTDTRTLAREWMERHVPAGASVLIQPYSVPLRTSREGLAEALTRNLGSADRASVRFRRQLAIDPYPAPAFRTIYLGDGGLDQDKIYVSPAAVSADTGLRPLEALGIGWVVMKQYHEPDPAMAGLEAALERGARLTATFSPYAETGDPAGERQVPPFLHNTDVRIDRALERPGPIIEIWLLE